jgi:hypothetical protein
MLIGHAGEGLFYSSTGTGVVRIVKNMQWRLRRCALVSAGHKLPTRQGSAAYSVSGSQLHLKESDIAESYGHAMQWARQVTAGV